MMHKRITITLVWLIIVFIAMFGVYRFEKPKKFKLPLLRGEVVGAAPDFSAIHDIAERKEAFFNYLKPGVRYENSRILQERTLLKRIKKDFADGQLSSHNLAQAQYLATAYSVALTENNVDNAWLQEIFHRVDVIPEALVLTQAANESAWGTSRFAKEANNYFGQWCYSAGCGLVPLARAEGAFHEVAKFDSVQDSIQSYFMNVNRNPAYRELREIRFQLRQQKINPNSDESAKAMSNGLLKYSERGEAYVRDLQAMMLANQEYWNDN
ncbi:glucosaminidase [Vibrio cholerae]|uniref:Bax protein n=2 Tax=Vibrio cholerae TaxID=666 RepID=A0A0H3AIN2_VIBC3|nr:putative bax protein [Vibrio cholerae O395]EGQ9501898.1 glucosaminidase [Vibrio cholerae]QHQ89875.1 glucosaminidase [Vibrio cholerae O1]ACP09556.1 putative bax protein [Vibrio cholerae O395]EGQ9612895.1 glucosaminidase [Vibrio cholerae]